MLFKLFLTALLGLITVANGEILEARQCGTYDGSVNFTASFISKMTSEERSYLFVMSSGRSVSCQRIKFFKNATFLYSYTDQNGAERNYRDDFTAIETSPLTKGSIRLLGLPFSVLQAGYYDGALLQVVAANDEQLVVVVCLNIGILSFETIGGLVDEDYLSDKINAVMRINETVNSLNFPRSNEIIEQSLSCAKNKGEPIFQLFGHAIRSDDTPNISPWNEFYNKLIEGGQGQQSEGEQSGGPSEGGPSEGGMRFFSALVNYPVGRYLQQEYFIPHVPVPRQTVGFVRGPAVTLPQHSQVKHLFYHMQPVTQNMFPQMTQNIIHPHVFQNRMAYPQVAQKNMMSQMYPQLPHAFVYPPVNQQSSAGVFKVKHHF